MPDPAAVVLGQGEAVIPAAVDHHPLDTGLLRSTVDALAEFIPGWLEEADGELPVLLALADVREARQDLATVEVALEREAAARMVAQRLLSTDPPLYAERRHGKDRREWDWDSLVRAVVSPLAADENGEVRPGAFEAAREIRECIAFTYARVGALKARGLAADEFCSSSPGRVTVTVSREVPDA